LCRPGAAGRQQSQARTCQHACRVSKGSLPPRLRNPLQQQRHANLQAAQGIPCSNSQGEKCWQRAPGSPLLAGSNYIHACVELVGPPCKTCTAALTPSCRMAGDMCSATRIRGMIQNLRQGKAGAGGRVPVAHTQGEGTGTRQTGSLWPACRHSNPGIALMPGRQAGRQARINSGQQALTLTSGG
jgi:hypothetical protein